MLTGLTIAVAPVVMVANADADVLIESTRPDGKVVANERVNVSRTLVFPDHRSAPLASRVSSIRALATDGAVSPDHRWMAFPAGSGIEVLPTDGGPSTVLRRRGNPASYVGMSVVWWSADSLRVSISQGRRDGGPSEVLSCVVASKQCSTRSVGNRLVLGVLGGERLVTSRPTSTRLTRAIDRYSQGWRSATATSVARDRRTLARMTRQSVDVVETDGQVRTLWHDRRSAASGLWTYLVSSWPQGDELLLAVSRFRMTIQTRRLRGRLQAKLDVQERGARLWHLDAEGRRLTTHPHPANDDGFFFLFGGYARVPGVGWLQRHGTAIPVHPAGLLKPSGDVQPLKVDGQPLTVRRLETRLLGRTPSLGPGSDEYRIAGYEPATNSAIVQYSGNRDRAVVARLPLDGTTPPSTVYRGVQYEALSSVHVW